jgi:hypothetical protein
MNKFDFTHGNGQPFYLNDLIWNDDAYRNAFNGIFKTFGNNFIVSGCDVTTSGTAPYVTITEGYVLLNGELLKVDAQSVDETPPLYYNKSETEENTTYYDISGSPFKPRKIIRAVLTNTPSNLIFDAKRLEEVIEDKLIYPRIFTVSANGGIATGAVHYTIPHNGVKDNIKVIFAKIKKNVTGEVFDLNTVGDVSFEIENSDFHITLNDVIIGGIGDSVTISVSYFK